jgi:uncharacterized protein HemX
VDHERDPPTRPLEPQPGAPPDPDPGYVPDERAIPHEELLDRIRSLRTGLALVGLLALAGLGVGVWALLEDRNDRDARGASPARVSQLEDRADQLEQEIGERASDRSVEELRSQQEELAEQVEGVSEDTAGEELAQSVEELRQDVEELEQRVDELEAQPADSP